MPKNQTQIPGTEPKIHRDVSKAAEAYVDARNERMSLTTKEIETRAVLVAAMKKHELSNYVDHDAGIEVVFESNTTEKIKVKQLDDDAGDDE